MLVSIRGESSFVVLQWGILRSLVRCRWGARGGGNLREAQLYALFKIATDASGIGWREGASKILVWFGDAEGHDPVEVDGEMVTEEKATRALQDNSIQVLSIDVDRMNNLGQAERISMATNGR